MSYPQGHRIVSYSLTVEELEELTTYGGDEARTFTDEQIDSLGKAIREAISDTVSEFLSTTASY